MLQNVLGGPFNPPPENMPHARAVYLGFVDKATRQPDSQIIPTKQFRCPIPSVTSYYDVFVIDNDWND